MTEKYFPSTQWESLSPARQSRVECDSTETPVDDDTPDCVEEKEGKDHSYGEPTKKLNIENDGAHFEEQTGPDKGQPGQGPHQKIQVMRQFFFATLFFTVFCRLPKIFSGVGEKQIRRFGCQDKAGNNRKILGEGRRQGGFQNPGLETELRPVAEKELCRLQTQYFLCPRPVLVPGEEQKIQLGHQLLDGLGVGHSAAAAAAATGALKQENNLETAKNIQDKEWQEEQD